MNKFSCNVNPTGDRYIFYENIHKYLKYGKICIDGINCDQYGGKCEFKGLTSDEKADIHTNICKRFRYLIHNILNEVPENNSPIEKADREYLNYWLNHEILMNDANICPKVFLQNMITRDKENILLRELKNYMYYIEDDDVKNMNMLYHLYNNYKEMNEINNSDIMQNEQTFMKYANNCVKKYKELKSKCSKETTHLSNALNIFKKKYEETELNKAKHPEWKIENLPSLDGTEDVQEKDTVLSKIRGVPIEIKTKPSIPQEQPALTVSTFAATSAHPAALTNPFAESGKSHF
ncbi:PIR protein [Plasmodium vivax]|uniref:VIR protein n=1 Tax=Plasmodium vivax TaxID=5855 RepID=A0A565A4R4_PLAVI|nr:PIR protein [Plasmodium vivax]